MSKDFPSSNPFRRKGISWKQSGSFESRNTFAQPPSYMQTPASTDLNNVQKKSVKKVRVQSPPSSPEGDLPSQVQEENSSLSDDPFDNPRLSFSDVSETEDTTTRASFIPPNPFQKTLATLEQTDGVSSDVITPVTTAVPGRGAGRQSLDVEAFKRLLMTGTSEITEVVSSNTSVITTTPQVGHMILSLNDGESSTDASSISRQSIFETIQEIHPESPRTSHEVSDPDGERRGVAFNDTLISEKNPAPPGSRHGKLIKVELREDGASAINSPLISVPQESLSSRQRSQSPKDLNKPLPPAPSRASHESDRDSIFDKEAAGKIPEPHSPSTSIRRKTPPAPPSSRRRSQLGSSSKPSQTPTGRLSPNTEDDKSSLSGQDTPAVSSSSSKAPPPPPRRPASTKSSSDQARIAFPVPPSDELDKSLSKSATAPLPPPTRKLLTKHLSRPQSTINMDGVNKRSPLAPPPPPPPPRQRASNGNSMEAPVLSPGSSRTGRDNLRQSIDSSRGEPTASQREVKSSDVKPTSNILADLTTLQREVDALRGQYEKRNIS